MACVAFRLFLWRVSPSSQPFQRVSLISCFHGVCRLQVVFTACVAFRLFSRPVSPSSWPFLACVVYKMFSRHVSPSGCFLGVCRLEVVSTACVTLRLAISGVCRFHSSFMVSFIFCSPFSVHSTCRLQLARACTTFKLLSWRVSVFLVRI